MPIERFSPDSTPLRTILPVALCAGAAETQSVEVDQLHALLQDRVELVGDLDVSPERRGVEHKLAHKGLRRLDASC